MEQPKPKIKVGVHPLNPKNLLGFDNWNDAEDLFLYLMREVKRIKNKFSRVRHFGYHMWMTYGKFITRESLEEQMVFVGLTHQDIASFIELFKKKEIWHLEELSWKWYFDLIS